MPVSADHVNDILVKFNERVETIISASDLDHHKGTSNMNRLQSISDRFAATVHENFTKQETTEAMIYAGMEDALAEIDNAAKEMSSKESFYLQGLGAVASPRYPADSELWNNIISDAASDIDTLGKTYATVINNMPKMLQERLDQDLANILESINKSFNADPSPNNANKVAADVKHALDTIDKNMEEVADATMKSNIETIVHSKMTELQEKEIALVSAESGMTQPQTVAWRTLAGETRQLILALGKSNYLVYDKVIRGQKLSVIDQKLALLDTIRINAVGIGQALSGYYGGTGSRRGSRKSAPIGGVGTSLGTVAYNPAPRANFVNGIPPGFAGFVGTMTKEQLIEMHPPETASSHIEAMHYYMTQEGAAFEEAHVKASANGFTPDSHGKTFSIGGGRRPLV
jgi:hypothetical protein